MRRKVMRCTYLAFLAVILFSLPAHANVGIPMLALVWPGMAIALIPIIIIESTVLAMGFGMTAGHAAWVVSVANVVSTAIGIPVTWFLVLLAQIPFGSVGIDTAKKRFFAVILESAWMSPYEDRALNWMVPAAVLVLLVPFLFASWFIEHQVAMWMLGDMNGRAVASGILIGNAITYGILAMIVATSVVYEYMSIATKNRSSASVSRSFKNIDLSNKSDKESFRWRVSESWRIANKRARQGIAELKAAEARIARKDLILIHGQAQGGGNIEGADDRGYGSSEMSASRPKSVASRG